MDYRKVLSRWDTRGMPQPRTIKKVFEEAFDKEDFLACLEIGCYLSEVIEELEDSVLAGKLYQVGASSQNLVGLPLVTGGVRGLLSGTEWKSILATSLYRHDYWLVRALIEVAENPGVSCQDVIHALLQIQVNTSTPEITGDTVEYSLSLSDRPVSPELRYLTFVLQRAIESGYLEASSEAQDLEAGALTEILDPEMTAVLKDISGPKVLEGEQKLTLLPVDFSFPNLREIWYGAKHPKGGGVTPSWKKEPSFEPEVRSQGYVEGVLSEVEAWPRIWESEVEK